jgi:uncharacterized protein GlcG (DUF336 family)
VLERLIEAFHHCINDKTNENLLGRPIWLSVVDLSGIEILSYFKEGEDERKIPSSKINAFRKAHTAMTYNKPTGPNYENGCLITNPYEASLIANGFYSNIPGGVPIYNFKPSEPLLGIGISGLTPEEDEELARKIVDYYMNAD